MLELDASSLLSGGTVGALVVGLTAVGRIIVGGIQERREHEAEKRKGREEQSGEKSARVQDEATQITVLNGTVETLGNQNDRLTKRVAELERSLADRDTRIQTLQGEITELQNKLADMSRELETIRTGKV